VERDAVRTKLPCRGCKVERDKAKLKPRMLWQVPFMVTNTPAFKKRGAYPGLFLCEHCDGDTFELILLKHDVDKKS
jgi:hypothetical protein